MIARVAVHIPESLWLQESAQFKPFVAEYNSERVMVYPPLQCPFEVRPDEDGNFNVNDVYCMLTPVQRERVYPFVRMNGEYVKHANLLQLDFIRADFNRNAGGEQDPRRDLIEAVVTNIVARLRYTIGAPTFREFKLLDTFWTVRYLDNEGLDLPEEKGRVRGRVNTPFRFRFTGLDLHSWEATQSLSVDFQPQLWERLFLDAQFLLPEVGPALTLAIAAIETAADAMIHDRLRGYLKKADALITKNRLGQRLDHVAKQLTGVSLKDEPNALWDAFDRLRRARNAAAHEGVPVIDGAVVDDQVALKMILAIRPVLDWIETRMSPDLRSHYEPHALSWEWRPPLQVNDIPQERKP